MGLGFPSPNAIEGSDFLRCQFCRSLIIPSFLEDLRMASRSGEEKGKGIAREEEGSMENLETF